MQLILQAGAVLLCLGLTCSAVPQSVDAGARHFTKPGRSPAGHDPELQGDERILQALNRFTFGPRPGDVEAVRAIGLDQWFKEQLHPASLNESQLDARLAQFPAMQWTTPDLLFRLPSNATIRQALRGRAIVPQNGLLHAIYADQMARIRARERGKTATDAKLAGGSENAPPPIDMSAPQSTDAASTSLDSTEPSRAGGLFDLPAEQRVKALAQMPQPELDGFLRSLRPAQRLRLGSGMTPDQAQAVGGLENPERTVIDELLGVRLTRDIYSNAQLQEVMTDFWLNHFNIYLHKNEMMPYYLVIYERDTIRPHALGKFEDLLEATAHSPAMLLYLDNSSSIGPDSMAAQRARLNAWRSPGLRDRAPLGINENYGRELMELHTIGVDGGYTQADVIQAARILTGWTVDRPQRGGGFEFNPNRHEPGVELVLGHKFRGSGEEQGRKLLHFLATRPATASFICHELAVRFVSDNPPPSLVERMVRTWMKSDGTIPAVLTTMFHSPEFWSASTYQAKVKTPLEYVVSAVRASDADVQNDLPLANALRKAGMPLYGCIPPNGYSWQSSAWVSAGGMVARLNFALALASNRLPGIRIDWAVLAGKAGSSPEAEEARLQELLIPGGISAGTQSAILDQFHQQDPHTFSGAKASTVSEQVHRTYLAGAPSEEQRREQYLAGLLLGSPAFQRR